MGPGDTVRIVTNDFMFNGGDGYTAFQGGTDVLYTGELLLDVIDRPHPCQLAGRAGGRRAPRRALIGSLGGPGLTSGPPVGEIG